MLKKLRPLLTTGLLALALFALVACGGFAAKALLQGNLDLIYLGTHDQDYLDSVQISEADADAAYNDSIAAATQHFCDSFDTDWASLSEASQQKITDVYKQIYQHSKYELGDATKEGNVYTVPLTVYPMDIMQKFAEEDIDAFITDWQQRMDAGEFNLATSEELTETWAGTIIDLLSQRVDAIGYLEPVVINVRIAPDETGAYAINADDFQEVDRAILPY